MKRIVWLAAAVFSLAYLNVLFAQTVDFSGTWKLDTGKSELTGRMWERVTGMTMVIEQSGNSLKMSHTTQAQDRERENSVDLTLGGDPVETTQMRGNKAAVKGMWADNQKDIIIATEMEAGRGDRTFTMKVEDTYVLSADGAVLTVTKVMNTPRGKRETKLIFNKQ